jgi:hypothetical protein
MMRATEDGTGEDLEGMSFSVIAPTIGVIRIGIERIDGIVINLGTTGDYITIGGNSVEASTVH